MNTSSKKTSRRGRMTYNEMRDALDKAQADAYRYYRMCRIRRDKVMSALDRAAFTRNLLVASVVFNLTLLVALGLVVTGAAK